MISEQLTLELHWGRELWDGWRPRFLTKGSQLLSFRVGTGPLSGIATRDPLQLALFPEEKSYGP